jgi:hypothetical protein
VNFNFVSLEISEAPFLILSGKNEVSIAILSSFVVHTDGLITSIGKPYKMCGKSNNDMFKAI